MTSSFCISRRKLNAFLRIVLSIVTITLLRLTLVGTSRSAYSQTSDDASTSGAAASSPADWTQFHRDNMQRWNPYEAILGPSNVGGLKVKWNYRIGASNFDAFQSSPVIVNGVVYLGNQDGNLYAFDAGTGTKLWSSSINEPIDSSPAVANGVVYVGGVASNGNVVALNATTGAKLWSFATRGGIEGSPTVVNGVVYVGSGDGKVYALNAATGVKLWSFNAGSFVDSSPAVANGMVYFGSGVYSGDLVLGQVYALNAKTGAQLWSFATGSSFDGTAVESSPAVANGVVYVAADDNNLYALDANTGAQLWSFAGIFVSSSPAVANGVVYIGSFSGLYANVYALNVTTGAQLWSFKPVGSIFNAPAVANGVVYVDTDNGNGGNLYALDAGTGAKLWSYANGDLWRSSPSIVDGVLYASSISSTSASATTLYAFSLGTGISADLFLRIIPSTMTVHQGDLITYAFPVWNLGPANADFEVLNTEVPAGTTLDYIRISGTPGLGKCTSPPYQGTGKIVCHENSAMAPNTTWTVRVVVKVTAPAGTVITANAATMSDTPDPNMANNMATVSVKVQ